MIDNTNDLSSLTNNNVLPMLSMPMSSQPNGTNIHHYYNATSQPYFHFNIPSHPVYCSSEHGPVWHQYFSAANNYPVCI